MTLAPLSAHAQNAPIVTKDRPFDAYPSTYSSNPIRSWLDMVSASQAAQPSWMTPLVTVTPRLEQEFRWDVYDQKNGTGTQGNGQRLVNYGGPGGARIELIPAYNWEVILAPPPYVTASGPKGTGQGTGRLAGLPRQVSPYLCQQGQRRLHCDRLLPDVRSERDLLHDPNNVLVAQPTLAFGKGWGDFDIQSTISTQIPVDSIGPKPKTGTTLSEISAIRCSSIRHSSIICFSIFGRNWRSTTPTGPMERMPAGIRFCSRPVLILGRFKLANDTATRPVNLIIGAGYQVAVTPNPVTQNNFVGTVRVTF